MSLEKRRKALELLRVRTAKAELAFKVEEKMDEIKRIEAHIKVQEEAELRIEKELQELN